MNKTSFSTRHWAACGLLFVLALALIFWPSGRPTVYWSPALAAKEAAQLHLDESRAAAASGDPAARRKYLGGLRDLAVDPAEIRATQQAWAAQDAAAAGH